MLFFFNVIFVRRETSFTFHAPSTTFDDEHRPRSTNLLSREKEVFFFFFFFLSWELSCNKHSALRLFLVFFPNVLVSSYINFRSQAWLLYARPAQFWLSEGLRKPAEFEPTGRRRKKRFIEFILPFVLYSFQGAPRFPFTPIFVVSVGNVWGPQIIRTATFWIS